MIKNSLPVPGTGIAGALTVLGRERFRAKMEFPWKLLLSPGDKTTA